jgi:alkaline phosphatase
LNCSFSFSLGERKDRKAYYEYLSKNFGLDDLNPSEKKRLDNALDFADSNKYKGDYTGSPASVVASIFSKRIGVKWVGKEHTGASVPLYAVGMRSEDFSGSIDNTDVGKRLFKIIDG